LDGKPGDDLRFAFVEELKILLTEVSHSSPFFVSHDHRHGYQIYSRAESDGRFLRGHFGLILREQRSAEQQRREFRDC
jgi:hypothetical protein